MLIFIFLSMIFLHIIDDFVLQPICLSNLKQKKFWEANAPNKLYKNDYKCALVIHAISWAFMIMLPIAIYYRLKIGMIFIILFIINIAFHGYMDNRKANKGDINLISDQLFHLWQIICTFLILLK